ncbi:PTS sugar transporter subunit IIA [Streptococcus gallolyticus]|nr:PTS sugar transporter subunit IIA [Streptococcus gallolyticus]MBY5040618.1 PTS sugar transporter subunit IIA [Streptococcus gallolyticus]
MAIINRWYRILETLVARHRVSFEEMRSDLKISAATLQKSIEQLNDILDADLQIRLEDNFLSLEVYDYHRLEEILAGSLRKESDFNSSSKRSSYLIKRLIQSPDPLLIDDLAEEIGVSRTTINKDLKHVKAIAEPFHIDISGKPNRGLGVKGTELQLRLFYLHYVYRYFDSAVLTEESDAILEQLYQTYKLPKKTQELLSKVISITVARIKRHRFLGETIPFYTNELADSEIMAELIYHLEFTYHLSLSQFEQDFISFPLNTQYIDSLAYQPIDEAGLENLYMKMVKRVKDSLGVHFDEHRLYTEMRSHLKFLINRLIFHVQANDLFHGEIQSNYPLAFEMAKVAASVLEEHLGGRVEPAELSYLALYFEMVLRGNEQVGPSVQRKIAVVCTTGRGTANMICRQLTRVLGQDIAITQYSEEEFDPLDSDDYFAIFTTIPLKFSGKKSPVIQITNLFDDQWLQNEWQRVNRYHQKNLETLTLKFVRLPKESSYQAYLGTMCRMLDEQGLVDKKFAERILEREEKQSTIFGNGIGFPHTINQQSSQTILMVGVMEEPHEEQNQALEFIFLVAIPQKVEHQMETELLELYDDIFRIAGDDNLKSELRNIQTESELLALSRSKGVF